MNINIRQASEQDNDAIWQIFHAVVQKGDTYVFLPEMPKRVTARMRA